MINKNELRKLAKEKGITLSKEFVEGLEKEIKQNIEDILDGSVRLSRHANRKTLKIEDLKLLRAFKK